MMGFEKLRGIKNKHAPNFLKVEGVYGVGIRVLEDKIVVYCREITESILDQIPVSVEENIDVDILVIENDFTTPYSTITEDTDTSGKIERPVYGGASSATVFSGSTGGGTFGSLWYSTDYDKEVMVSNNHVFANRSFIWQQHLRGRRSHTLKDEFGVAIELTINAGQEYSGSVYHEDTDNIYDYVFLNNASQASNVAISSATVSVGDTLTITCNDAGTRLGYGKIFFVSSDGNKVEAKVKSWAVSNLVNYERHYIKGNAFAFHTVDSCDNVIEVYIPSGAEGSGITIEYESEGLPIVQPALGDYTDTKMINPPEWLNGVNYKDYQGNTQTIGEGDHYCAPSYLQIAEYLDHVPADQNDNAKVDLAIAQPVGDTSRVRRGVKYREYRDGEDVFISGKKVAPFEWMPVVATGRTTGSTCSIIGDPSFSHTLDYGVWPAYDDGDGYSQVVNFTESILYYAIWGKDGYPDKSFGNPGDSGSTVFATTKQNYLDFMEQYHCTHGGFDTDYVQQMWGSTDIDAYNGDVIGSIFFGKIGTDPKPENTGTSLLRSGSDNVANFAWNMDILKPIPTIRNEVISGGTSVEMEFWHWLNVRESIEFSSNTHLQIDSVYVLEEHSIEPFELQSTTPSAKDSVNFELEHIREWIIDCNSVICHGEISSTSLIVTQQITTSKAEGIASATSPALIVPIDIQTNPSYSVGFTSVEIDTTSADVTELQSFGLQPITPSTNDEVNFELQIVGDIQSYEITTNVASGLGVANNTTLNALDVLDIQAKSSGGVGYTSIDIRVIDNILLNANSVNGLSATSINLRVKGLITLTVNGVEGLSSVSSLYMLTQPKSQYEEITLTISKSKEFNVTITRSEIINTEIRRSHDLKLII